MILTSKPVGVYHCLETFCHLQDPFKRKDSFVRHLKEIHRWGDLALSALRDLQVQHHHEKRLAFYCLHPHCNLGTRLSNVRGSDLETFRSSHRLHPRHPYLFVPLSNVESSLGAIDPDIFSQALQSIKPFIWRINKRLSDIPLCIQAVSRDQSDASEIRRIAEEISVSYLHLNHTWETVHDRVFLGREPGQTFSDYLDHHLHERLKTLADIDHGLDTLIKTHTFHLRVSVVQVCSCGESQEYGSHQRRHACSISEDLMGISARHGPLYAIDPAHKINAVHSVAWLIRTELAYIVQCQTPDCEEKARLHRAATEYDQTLCSIVRFNHCESIWSLMNPLVADLAKWRSISRSTDTSTPVFALDHLDSQVHSALAESPSHHHLVTLDYLLHWEHLHDPQNASLYHCLTSPIACILCISERESYFAHDYLHHVRAQHEEQDIQTCELIQKTFGSRIWQNPRHIILEHCIQVTQSRLTGAMSQHPSAEDTKWICSALEKYTQPMDDWFYDRLHRDGPRFCKIILNYVAHDLLSLGKLSSIRVSSSKIEHSRYRKQQSQPDIFTDTDR